MLIIFVYRDVHIEGLEIVVFFACLIGQQLILIEAQKTMEYYLPIPILLSNNQILTLIRSTAMKTRQIKFTVIAKKWFDKVNGNTYHSVRCIRHKDNAVVVGQFRYGYGEHYKQTALAVMFDAGWFRNFRRPEDTYYIPDNLYLFEQEKNYPILWTVSEGLKRDCVANGQL